MTSPRDAGGPVQDQDDHAAVPTVQPQAGGPADQREAAVPGSGPAAAPQVTAPAGQPPQQVPPPVARPPQHVVRRTRMGGLWVGLALAAVVLLLLLVFILENEQSADIGYFGAHGHLPLGVALLLAAVAGALLVIIPGTARIIQLRITARRHRALDAAAPANSPQAAPAGPLPGNPVQ
jgi:uncharacterized integral membrane protein